MYYLLEIDFFSLTLISNRIITTIKTANKNMINN